MMNHRTKTPLKALDSENVGRKDILDRKADSYRGMLSKTVQEEALVRDCKTVKGEEGARIVFTRDEGCSVGFSCGSLSGDSNCREATSAAVSV